LHEIQKIRIRTQESAMRIINKLGPLHNPADRDHCLQYITAVSLLFGELTAEHYEDSIAKDPRIDSLRQKTHVSESPEFSKSYIDPDKRTIGNAIQIFFNDGSFTKEVVIEYPIGHRKRREEGVPLLMEKFTRSVHQHFGKDQAEKILAIANNEDQLLQTPIDQFTQLLHCPDRQFDRN
jgi:2-methylcitrate dehydratase